MLFTQCFFLRHFLGLCIKVPKKKFAKLREASSRNIKDYNEAKKEVLISQPPVFLCVCVCVFVCVCLCKFECMFACLCVF